MTGDGVGGGAQVPLCKQVRVDVVVCQGAVLIGAGDAVDAEAALGVVMPERTPEPGCLDEQLEADLELEGLVPGRGLVADDPSAMSPPTWTAAVPAGQ